MYFKAILTTEITLYPSYLALYESGELKKRVKELKKRLASCDLCPRNCRVNRNETKDGYCQSGRRAYICSFCDHHGEEPPLSGINGSGTIFLGRCNLRCVFCQNADISQHLKDPESYACSAQEMARIMIYLQNELNCHNINFVSPSHFVAQIVEAVYFAIPLGLCIPLVYNSNGYDSLYTLQQLDGIFDIYLPDLKYADDTMARKYSTATHYTTTSRQAIKEMFRQVGLLEIDKRGIATSGLIIRHLVLPNHISGSIASLHWITEELSPLVTLSLMAQYYPANYAGKIPVLARPLSYHEYAQVLQTLEQLGLENALYQQLNAAEYYRPHFAQGDHPFE
jgi:putative pyruvate formate lyase activating enzyme